MYGIFDEVKTALICICNIDQVHSINLQTLGKLHGFQNKFGLAFTVDKNGKKVEISLFDVIGIQKILTEGLHPLLLIVAIDIKFRFVSKTLQNHPIISKNTSIYLILVCHSPL